VGIDVSPDDFDGLDPEVSSESPFEDNHSSSEAPKNAQPSHGQLISKSAALTYLSKKLDPQRAWFDKKAERSKLFYYYLLGTSMIATSSIVVANSLHFGALSTGLAVVATVTTGFSSMVKFQEHWIRYRNTATALEALKLRYEIGMHPFDGPNRHGLLIEEAEKVFEKEQSQWAAKSSENVRQPANRNIPM
jgi:hypothetical protein